MIPPIGGATRTAFFCHFRFPVWYHPGVPKKPDWYHPGVILLPDLKVAQQFIQRFSQSGHLALSPQAGMVVPNSFNFDFTGLSYHGLAMPGPHYNQDLTKLTAKLK